MHKLYEIKEMLYNELEKYGGKELTAGSLEMVDKLAHAIKNICKIIDEYEDEEYSEEGGSYARGRGGNRSRGSYAMEGNSYARGRGRNARRDSMGRYSSANDMIVEELRDLMEDAQDERTKAEFRKFIQKVEQM